MLIKILVGLVILALVFIVVVMLQPASFRVERTAIMSAPALAAFSQVNDFHNWEAWSPYAKMDPQARKTFEGPPAGAGSMFAWSGNNKIGEGRMTITESHPSDLIRINLAFSRPFQATNIAEFTFKPAGNQTAVTWSMSGRKNFISKAFCLFANMDRLVGTDFEKGLASMKSIVEAENPG